MAASDKLLPDEAIVGDPTPAYRHISHIRVHHGNRRGSMFGEQPQLLLSLAQLIFGTPGV